MSGAANPLLVAEPEALGATARADDEPSVIRGIYALIIWEVACGFISVDTGITTMMVNPLESAFHLNDFALAAVTLTPVAIGSGLATYPGGLLGDAFRRTTVITWGSLLCTLATALVIFVHSPVMLFAARFLAGVGLTVGIPGMASAICDVFPHRHRAYAFGAWNVLLALGGGVAIALTANIVALAQHVGSVHIGGMHFVSWQICFGLVSLCSLIITLLQLTVQEPPRADDDAGDAADLRDSVIAFGGLMRRQGWLWTVYVAATTLGGLAVTASAGWAPTLADRNFHAPGPGPMNELGLYTMIGSLIGSIGLGALGQYLNVKKRSPLLPFVLAAIALISTVIALVYPFAPGWTLAAVGLGAIGGISIGFNTLGYLFVTDAVPNRLRGQLWGAMGLLGVVPAAIVPNLTAYLANGVFVQRGGYAPALAAIGAGGGVVAVVLYLALARPYARAVVAFRGAEYR